MLYRVRRNRKNGTLEFRIERGARRNWDRGQWKPFTRETLTEQLLQAHTDFAAQYGSQGKLKLAQVKRGGES